MMKNYKVVMLFGYVELCFEMQGEEYLVNQAAEDLGAILGCTFSHLLEIE